MSRVSVMTVSLAPKYAFDGQCPGGCGDGSVNQPSSQIRLLWAVPVAGEEGVGLGVKTVCGWV